MRSAVLNRSPNIAVATWINAAKHCDSAWHCTGIEHSERIGYFDVSHD